MIRHLGTAALLGALAFATPAGALTTSDTLASWRNDTAMNRVQLATRLGRSFIAVNDGFTAEYFIKCIDGLAVHGGSDTVTIENAVRECVAARLRQLPSTGE